MDAKLKENWLSVTAVILGLVLLIDGVQEYLPPGALRTALMIGIVIVGFAGIFMWSYFQGKPRSKQIGQRADSLYKRFTKSAALRTWLH